ncbi:MAG TPA: AAA family ATPase [Trebonia sp.]|jgi:DNA-binding NarL/FixJ family response regulator|nr:AAA family ATPase [Trebonia sp.]
MDACALTEIVPAVRLRGRQAEVDALRELLDAVRDGRGGTVLVTGLAGLGKTVLLDAAAEMARERGIRVFRGAGSIAAQVIPLSPLFEALVSAPDAPVDPAVLRDLSLSPDQRFWLLRELQEGLERAALRAPVLIALDDLQWADPGTLAALGALPRQVASHRILWLLTVRSGELSATAQAVVSRLEAARPHRITLSALDGAAVAAVAADLLGGVPDAGLRHVLDRVQGHPFLLTELLRGLREEGLAETGDGVARLTGPALPLRFRDSVGYQLTHLSPGARDALQMAAVLGRRFSADELSALTGMTPAAVLAALREALAAGLVTEDGDRMTFRHDIIREVVDATLPRTVRQSLRRRAVDVMLAHGAPPSDVAELVLDVARPGDREAITILRRAAAETGRVSPTVAATLSRRALDLTPPGDRTRGTLTAETMAYLVFAGKAAAAVQLITAGAEDLVDHAAEAEARLRLAILSNQYSPADSVEQCRRALALPDVPAMLRIQLQSNLSVGLDLLGDVEAARQAAGTAARMADTAGDPAGAAVTLLPRAVDALGRGRWPRAIRLVSAATASQHDGDVSVAVRHWRPAGWHAVILTCGARLDEAFALIDGGLRDAQRDGISAHIRLWSMIRCRALYSAGQLADARSDAEAAIDMADEIGDGSYGYVNQVCLYLLARVALHAGDPAGLAQARTSARRLSETRDCPSARLLGGWLTALLADADGEPGLAAGIPVESLDPLATGGLTVSNPQMYADIPPLTSMLLRAGRDTDAAAVVARLEEFATRNPEFPFLERDALHARAVLDADAETALRAVALSDDDPRPLVRARVLEDAGRLLAGDRAAEGVPLLETALAAYLSAGAERDAARVRGLLRARGVRPAASGPRSAPEWPELTESEFAVVTLVARGATNRAVAEQLHLSPYTVNSHLRHVFGKLGIRSRTELAFLAAERGLLA